MNVSTIECENVLKNEPKKKIGIESFLVSKIENLLEVIDEKVGNVSNYKYAILSSSSDEKEDCEETETKKKRLLKSKRDRNKTRKAKPLEESGEYY